MLAAEPLDTLAPVAETFGQVGIILGTIVVCWRLFNSTWSTAATTLRESANYARQEAEELRERVDSLEATTREQAKTIAALNGERTLWQGERASLERHVAVLGDQVERLTETTKRLERQLSERGNQGPTAKVR